jgi:hypothetical protein
MRRIVCVGGGPASLYAAILLRKALPATRIEVYERNRPDDTFGWGVVFSDQTMENFHAADPASHAAILANFHHWDDIAIHFRGRRLVSSGHGFCGIGRKRLLALLQERARELGVHQQFQHEVEGDAAFADADPHHRRRQGQQPCARALCGGLRARRRRAQVPLHLAGDDPPPCRVHVRVRATNPQRRLIEPHEVAHAVLWLCRPGAESVTGQSIILSGGEVT